MHASLLTGAGHRAVLLASIVCVSLLSTLSTPAYGQLPPVPTSVVEQRVSPNDDPNSSVEPGHHRHRQTPGAWPAGPAVTVCE